MTVELFIKWAEGYYGYPYNPIQRQEISNELMYYNEDFIEAIKEEVKHTLSTSYNTPPSVADIEKAKPGAYKRLENILSHKKALQHNRAKQKAITDSRDGNKEEDYREQIVEMFAKLKQQVHIETREEP